MPFQIAIVGGGIAGLAAAIALRAPGRQITVLEQSRLLAEIGATISLQPNASRILQREWELEGLLERARGMIDHGFRIYNTDGQMVNSVPLAGKTEYEGDRIMYHRQDLHEVYCYNPTQILIKDRLTMTVHAIRSDLSQQSGTAGGD